MSQADREVRLGWRLTRTIPEEIAFELGAKARRREPGNDNEDPDQGVGLRMTDRW
ncbi:MAG: hypothetical protein OXD40_05115 [bacterium]|nr:hypothetical protein [bacterium]